MNKKVTIATICVIAVLLAGSIAWLFIAGKVTVVWAGSASKQVTQAAPVCDSRMVSAFNSAIYYTIRDNSGKASIDKKALDGLAGSIQTISGYKNDPTCQTILFWVAYGNQDYAATKSAYDALVLLRDSYKFPDNTLSTSGGFSQYIDMVNTLSPNNKGDKKGGAEGGAG